MHSCSPLACPTSPAVSEISVGSPSPPLIASNKVRSNFNQENSLNAFRPLHLKRIAHVTNVQTPIIDVTAMMTENMKTSSNFATPIRQPSQYAQRRKSSGAERMKSFSIADILGKSDASSRTPSPQQINSRSPSTPPTTMPPLQSFEPPSECPPVVHVPASPTISLVLPSPQLSASGNLLSTHILGDRLEMIAAPPLVMTPSQLMLDTNIFPKSSQHTLKSIGSTAATIPLRSFLPPTLLQYEHRLAWDYQRQLQEHFQVQAQILHQMSMDPSIIRSEDGSEHSHSSSTDSECYSPGLNDSQAADAASLKTNVQNNDKSNDAEASCNVRDSDDPNIQKSPNDTPLDALFQLSTKNFDDGTDPATLDIFSSKPNPKKKRKSRTAFTNHQIFELEKRFLYQKYLTPVDRDDIAGTLGLSNAQVITWFQNRRAKLKRDMEELKKDVESVKQLPDQSADISSSSSSNSSSIHQYQSVYRQRLQQHQQHLIASLNNNQQHHMLTISPLSCLKSQSPVIQNRLQQQHQHQQQQKQKQHQNHFKHHHNHNTTIISQEASILPLKSQHPTTTTLVTTMKEREGLTAAAQQTSIQLHTNNLGCTKSISAAGDKKELKMLKMMTLMYYSSRAQVDALSGDTSISRTMYGRNIANGNNRTTTNNKNNNGA